MRVISSQFFSGTKEMTRARIMRVNSRQKRVNKIRASFVKDARRQMRVDTRSLAGALRKMIAWRKTLSLKIFDWPRQACSCSSQCNLDLCLNKNRELVTMSNLPQQIATNHKASLLRFAIAIDVKERTFVSSCTFRSFLVARIQRVGPSTTESCLNTGAWK